MGRSFAIVPTTSRTLSFNLFRRRGGGILRFEGSQSPGLRGWRGLYDNPCNHAGIPATLGLLEYPHSASRSCGLRVERPEDIANLYTVSLQAYYFTSM